MSVEAVFLTYGKRKSGKDFISVLLKQILDSEFGQTALRRISDPLKEEYAVQKGLHSAAELKTDGPLKEVYRAEMIKFGEDLRVKDSGYFCRQASSNLPQTTKFLLITDCRRPTDLDYFKDNFKRVFTIAVVADLEVRTSRGFVFTSGIDDAESECALDGYAADATIDNSGIDDDSLKAFLRHIVTELLN
uniref:Phosphomevalonate kinase n=1 Tax=Panagrellus redivivus TaxID=6233 RepID=A0A7E4WBJ7_PANRE